MPKVTLNQGGAYQLCGIRLEAGENQLSDADLSVLNSQGGFLNDVKHGLIVVEAPEVKEALKTPATPKGK
jgi:hypothetical protein